jgi:hypothetical protein
MTFLTKNNTEIVCSKSVKIEINFRIFEENELKKEQPKHGLTGILINFYDVFKLEYCKLRLYC